MLQHPLQDDEPGIVKLCQFPAVDESGHQLIEIFNHPDQLHHSYMDKVASPFLPQVREYIDGLRPDPNSIYALVNALGAFEYWGSNINADAFEEEHLIHRGPIWGYETFLHYAKIFAHHSNKGPNARPFGDVKLSCWHDHMKRVELVVRIDRQQAHNVGAHKFVDKIDHGQLPDVSMGCKVPYDLCSITTDWELYRKALSTFDPRRDRHPGIAVLRYHKAVQPIKGLSITRDDYSEYMKTQANQILSDGRKVCVFNPFPRFFDISFVFIGADKTSKMLAKLASRAYVVVPSSYVAEEYGYTQTAAQDQPTTHKSFEMEKAASIEEAREKLRAFKKRASQRKKAEIIKEIVPSQFGSKAVPILEDSEKDLPKDVLNRMGGCSLREAFSTPTMLGMTLKPREFQRITLCNLGKADLADKLDDDGKIFSPTDRIDKSIPMGSEFISSLIGQLLKDSIDDRSAFGPPLKRRMIRITIVGKPPIVDRKLDETNDELLDKVSAAYNGYREQVIEKIADLSQQLGRHADLQAAVLGKDEADIFVGMQKEAAGINPKLLLGAVPATYLLSALARHKVRSNAVRGKPTGTLTGVLADHPHLAATAVGMAVLKAGGSNLPDKLLKGAITLGKRVAGIG
jgi:hypothetical protein